ncbi:MAG: hypothetical protein ACYSWS_11475 [Planctomycetota bacterium]
MSNFSEKFYNVAGISLLANIIAIPIAGYLFYSSFDPNTKIQRIYDNHNQQITDIHKKYENELAKTVDDYERRIKENYDQLYNVIHDSSVVSSNLDTLKDAILNTNTASSADIAKIEDVLLGLNYLVNQYESPLYNFKEIENYIIGRLGIEHLSPSKRFAFLKMLFSRKYRKKLKEYHKYEGGRDVLVDMRERIHVAYEKAQVEVAANREGIMNHVKALEIMNRERKYDNKALLRMISDAQDVLEIHGEFIRLK